MSGRAPHAASDSGMKVFCCVKLPQCHDRVPHLHDDQVQQTVGTAGNITITIN